MSRDQDTAARAALLRLFEVAVEAADPRKAVLANLPPKPKGRCVVIGSGKASAVMASALEAAWPDVNLSGIVSTRYGHAVPAGRISVIQAAHPVPDENSTLAAQLMVDALRDLTADDLVICLMSGGASSLAVMPTEGVTLAEKRALNQQLLMSGASITEMNAIRQCLSRIKGGRLASFAGPAPVVTLVLSDVPGDDAGVVGSGPTICSPQGPDLARASVSRYQLKLPGHIRAIIGSAEAPAPRPQDRYLVIGSAAQSLKAAAQEAHALGYRPLILSDSLEGESRDIGRVLATMAVSAATSGLPFDGPAVILSGGETTVSVTGDAAGRGGRNSELLLSATLRLDGHNRIWALAADTDGIDGADEAAGAIATPSSLERCRKLGLDPRAHLDGHDSGSLFAALGDHLVTGPTLTNVNDFRAFLITA
ncbi:glycerate kinase type-2 family protein [Devosia marina]|uniref:DUF4147 domain-containing protein n=1 Tax=Devosia marina TaxID=2683198 RepID=A0A7X3FTF8_9HYPH|nr:glycerate kinase [Devosia marina]MVS99932.1 DUF4147 domain-containing protein [Devosia marina]